MGSSPAGPVQPPKFSGTNDRRLAERRNVVDSHLVTVDLAFQSGALLLDLSETGMGVQALSSAPIGATTSLHFELPETGGRVEAVGRITWNDSSGRLGIHFEELAEVARAQLAQWLSSERGPSVAGGPNVAMPRWPPPRARDEIAALRRDLISAKLEGDAALAVVVERVRNVTRATGAALAIEDGNSILCRASSGNAPPVGTRMDPNSGLSGECVRTGEIVRCEDTETDPRADRIVCRKLELRSIVIVPIRIHGRSAGVLEAFSSRAHAFQSSDVLLLRRISDLAAGIAVRQPEMPSVLAGPQALTAATPVDMLLAEEPSVADDFTDGESPLMMEDIFSGDAGSPSFADLEPMAADTADWTPEPPPSFVPAEGRAEPLPVAMQVESPGISASAEKETPSIPPQEGSVESPAEGTASEASPNAHGLAAEAGRPSEIAPAEPPVPPATKVEVETPIRPVVQMPAPRPVSVPAPATLEDLMLRSTAAPSAMGAMGAMGAAVAVPARQRLAPLDIEEEPQQSGIGLVSSVAREELFESALQKPSPWRLRITGAAILLGVLLIGGWQVWRAIAPPRGTPMDSENNRKPAASSPTTASAAVVETASPAPSTTITVASATAAGPAAPETPVGLTRPVPGKAMTTASATPAKSVAASAPATTPVEISRNETVEAPSVGEVAARSPNSSTLANLLKAPVPAPSLERQVVSEMTGGKLLKRVNPVYPATTTGLGGEVVLKAIIDKEGKVSRVQVISGNAILAQSAAVAVRRWRYEPFRLNGVPIEMENTIVVNFKGSGR
jgi:TonB family protein